MAGTEAAQTTDATAAAAVVNGAAAGGAKPSVLVPPQIGERRAKVIAARSAARAETLAMLESGADEGAEVEAEVEAKPAAAVEVESDEADDDIPDAEPPPAKTAIAAKKAEEPAVAGGLAKIQAAEKKQREVIAKERAAFEKERAAHEAELKELRAKAEQFETLRKTAPVDVVAAFEALGIDLEHGAKVAWQHHLAKKDPANPQHREIVAKLTKDRASDDKLSNVEKELAALKATLEQKELAEKTERESAQYFTGMARAIETSAETPLLKTALGKNPQGTWKKLANIAFELHQEHGELPDAADVIATYEKRRLEELDELGIAPPTVAATTNTSATTKKNHTPADKKQPAKTLGTDLSTPVVVKPRSGKSEREHRAETLELLESGKLE